VRCECHIKQNYICFREQNGITGPYRLEYVFLDSAIIKSGQISSSKNKIELVKPNITTKKEVRTESGGFILYPVNTGNVNCQHILDLNFCTETFSLPDRHSLLSESVLVNSSISEATQTTTAASGNRVCAVTKIWQLSEWIQFQE